MKIQLELKKLRKQYNLTQAEIASILNITSQAYGKYENGKRSPDPETLLTLAKYFNVSIDYLLGNANNKNDITAKEKELLRLFNNLDEQTKALALGYLQGLSENINKKVY